MSGDAARTVGVLLMAYGGPGSLDDVEQTDCELD